MEIEVAKKPKSDIENEIKITTPEDIYNLNVIQNIKDGIQEHLLLLGLDKGNNLRSVNLVGVGTSDNILINSKDILKTTLLYANDRVILAHNHPSNSLKASEHDIDFTNKINKFLGIFNIELLDHIIVTENGYLSMMQEKQIDKNYTNNDIKFIEKTILIEENNRLKQKIDKLSIQNNNELDESDEMEF